MPEGRSELYAVWRACERLNIRPPDVKESYDDCNQWVQAHIMMYNNVRSVEENDQQMNLFKIFFGK